MPLSSIYEKSVQSQAACLWLFANGFVCRVVLVYVIIGSRKEQKFELKLELKCQKSEISGIFLEYLQSLCKSV